MYLASPWARLVNATASFLSPLNDGHFSAHHVNAAHWSSIALNMAFDDGAVDAVQPE